MAPESDMQINGYILRDALQRWDRKRTLATKMFPSSFYKFEGDSKPSPNTIMEQFLEADRNYARIQEIQQRYNSFVTVTIQDETISLSLAVKLISGAGRAEKMWANSIELKSKRYSYDDDVETTRSKDTIYANRTMSEEACLEKAEQASRNASNLRTAIAQANATSVSLLNAAFNDGKGMGVSSEEFKTLFIDAERRLTRG